MSIGPPWKIANEICFYLTNTDIIRSGPLKAKPNSLQEGNVDSKPPIIKLAVALGTMRASRQKTMPGGTAPGQITGILLQICRVRTRTVQRARLLFATLHVLSRLP
jgi:hypothetical protein